MQKRAWETIEEAREDLDLPDVPGYEWCIYVKEPALNKPDSMSANYMWIGYASKARNVLETLGSTPETVGWWAAVRPNYREYFSDRHATGPYDNPQDAINALVTRVLLGDVFHD